MKRKTTRQFLMGFLLLVAVVQSGSALTIQAGQAQVKTIGDLNGDAWNLWSNGEWADFIHFEEAGDYQIHVHCYGSPVNGVWPEMALIIDDSVGQPVTVASDKPSEYVFPLRAGQGACRIGVSFLNDGVSETEDRNLYMLSMSIKAVGDGRDPTLTTSEKWRIDIARKRHQRESAVMADAEKAIETNRKRDATLCVTDGNGHPLADARIDVELIRHDFLFGGNFFMFDGFGNPEDNERYKDCFRDLFNYATTGFYWKAYEPERGKPDYAYTDKVVDWCARNHIRLKGHPLLWAHEAGIPPWSKAQPPEDLRRQRVIDITTRYAGKIDFWEVVNEPTHLPGLTIDDPYRWARQADPQAHLIVNDYNIFADGYPPFFNLLKTAIDNQVPFDGIGIQAHEPQNMRFPLDQVWKVLDQYATLGKAIHVTEFCLTSNGEDIIGPGMSGSWNEAAQADYATRFYTVCFAHPAVMAITWWDLSDAGSWRKGGGLLRANLSPKPAYTALKELIHKQWTTRTGGVTGPDGRFAFRGFLGDYVTRITYAGTVIEQPFHLGPGKDQIIDIPLSTNP